jgi:SAM-dependent methyltransferase
MRHAWKYLAHFWYVAVNWSLPMAVFMVVDNIRGTRKYGAGTFLPAELKSLTIRGGNVRDGSRYEAVSYYMLEHLFIAFRKLSDETEIVDLGCGKGRAMMVAPYFGFTKVTGVDFAEEVCAEARHNMQVTARAFPGLDWKVLTADVLEYDIQPADSVFFMFNPFNERILGRFLERLESSYLDHPRPLAFIYASPQHLDLLQNAGFAVVYRKKKMYLESIIAIRDLGS